MKRDKDKILLGKIARGNKKAFDTLFRKYYQQLVNFAIGYMHDGAEAEELVQDVMVKFWQQAQELQIEVSVQAYLYTSVRNKALNALKHEKVKQKYIDEQASRKTVVDDSDTSVNMDVFRKELHHAMSELPERCRQIFELAKFEGLTYDEIATFLEVSSKTVENQMGIAMKKLREALSPAIHRVYES